MDYDNYNTLVSVRYKYILLPRGDLNKNLILNRNRRILPHGAVHTRRQEQDTVVNTIKNSP